MLCLSSQTSCRSLFFSTFAYLWLYLCFSLSLTACQSSSQLYSGNRYVMPIQSVNAPTQCNSTQSAKAWAVVAGVNFYQDERIPDLKGAVNDAWNFYHYLVSPNGARFEPDRVRLLLNEQATRAGIEDALGQFLTSACPQDKVVIYFAGHGAPEPDRPEEAFLLMHDTNLDSMVSSAVSMSQLPKFLQWRAGQTAELLMLIDACHSGNIKFPNQRGITSTSLKNSELGLLEKTRAKSVQSTLKKMVKNQNGWGAISAAAANQTAGESAGGVCQLAGKDYNGGLFTCALLESFDGKADQNQDKALSLDELFKHVSGRLVSMRGLDQIPQRSGNMSGHQQLFPTIDQKLELPQVPLRYLRETHPHPYRPWLYGSLTLSGVALASSIAMNFIANQSARDANQYTASAATELAGPQGYNSLSQRYEEDRSTAMQLYISTAILSAIAGGLFTMDALHQPEGEAEVYRRAPAIVLERQAP